MSDKRDLELLLSEVLIDPSQEGLSRAEALSKFRRAVRARTILRQAACGSVFLILAVVVLLPFKKGPSQTALRPETAQQPSKKMESPAKLSDEELLRSFPPGSCFLAEVNGKTVLVFTDESTKKRLLN